MIKNLNRYDSVVGFVGRKEIKGIILYCFETDNMKGIYNYCLLTNKHNGSDIGTNRVNIVARNVYRTRIVLFEKHIIKTEDYDEYNISNDELNQYII